jgi:hypothetical protein
MQTVPKDALDFEMGAAASSTPKESKKYVWHQSSTPNDTQITRTSVVASHSLRQTKATSASLIAPPSLARPVCPMEDDVFSAHSQAPTIQPTQDDANYSDLMCDEEMDSPTPAYQRRSEKTSRKGQSANTPLNKEVRFTCINVSKQNRKLIFRP